MGGAEMGTGHGSTFPKVAGPDLDARLYEVEGMTEFVLYNSDGYPTIEVRSYIVDRKNGGIRSLIFNPREITTEQAMKEFRDWYR